VSKAGILERWHANLVKVRQPFGIFRQLHQKERVKAGLGIQIAKAISSDAVGKDSEQKVAVRCSGAAGPSR
jgi:hypothetical protein